MKETEILIIGQGPAGLSAGIYSSRAGIKTVILGCEPKISGDYDIDNYFGFPDSISGKELIENGMKQLSRFGSLINCDRVIGIHYDDSGKYIVKTENDEYRTCSVILATGVSRNKPNIPGIDKYEGKGISYCVSCDGFFFKNKKVIVAGEGLYAANQALELLNYTPDVSICTLGLRNSFSDDFAKKLSAAGIQVIEKKITSLHGEVILERVTFEDKSETDVSGLFIAIGNASSVDFAKSLGIITEGNFIQVDREMKTNAPGIFAAGDCTGGFLQISVAVGEGAIAGKSAIDYVRKTCRESAK